MPGRSRRAQARFQDNQQRVYRRAQATQEALCRIFVIEG
jgi:uncharacterized protein YukE